MSLTHKLAKRAKTIGLAGSLGFLTGCATTDNTPNAYGTTEPGQQIIEGVLDFATGGIFNPEGGWANPKPKVIVNNYPAQQQAVQPATLLFASNGYQDRNGDGAITYPNEFLNPNKSRFSQNEDIQITFYNRGDNHSSPLAIKRRVTHLNTQKSATDNEYTILGPNRIVNFSCDGAALGTYKYEILNDKNEVLGTTFFEVYHPNAQIASNDK